MEMRYAMVAEIHGNSPVTRPIDGRYLVMVGKLFPYVNQSGGGAMSPMVCRIWVTWISNFFLRALSTSIGGGVVFVSIQDATPDTRATQNRFAKRWNVLVCISRTSSNTSPATEGQHSEAGDTCPRYAALRSNATGLRRRRCACHRS